jgi:hypothetical protein
MVYIKTKVKGRNISVKIKLTIIVVVFMLLQLGVTAFAAEDTGAWYPFTIPWDDGKDNVINAGKLVLDAPAGKHGFLTTKDGHFYFEDGTRIRFWGTGLILYANFPTHEEAEKVAGHLAKYGFNMVRLHHLDTGATPAGIFKKQTDKNTLTLDDDQLDKLDYLVYQLKQKGIYVDMDLFVSRPYSEADGVNDAGKLNRFAKGLTLFDDKLVELQKNYANQLLTHYNKYTSTTYNNEPAVAIVETANENSLFNLWANGILFGKTQVSYGTFTDYYLKELDDKWNKWLKDRYGDDETLGQAWGRGDSTNMVCNPGFESDISGTWFKEVNTGANATFTLDEAEKSSGNRSLRVDITQVDKNANYKIQVKQLGITLSKDKTYMLRFKSKADKARGINVSIMKDTSPYTNYGATHTFTTSTGWQEYRYSFKPSDNTDAGTRLTFIIGQSTGTVWLDDVELVEMSKLGLGENESIENGNIARTKWEDRTTDADKRFADNVEFYYSIERDYFKKMLSYIKNDLGVRVPVETTNFYIGQPNLLAQAEGDFIDNHGYWDHPTFIGNVWDENNFHQTNLSLIRSNSFISSTSLQGSSYIGQLTLSPVKGKPFIVSEWNSAFPNDYEYETVDVIAAYARLQDWDGVFVHDYSGQMPGKETPNFFDVVADAAKMAEFPAAAVAFIRGDIAEANKEIVLNYSNLDTFNRYKEDGNKYDYNINGRLPYSAAYTYKIRKNFNADKTSSIDEIMDTSEAQKLSTEKTHTSDTGQLVWNAEEANCEYITFNTDKFQGADGFISGKKINLNNLTLDLSTNSSVSLVSMDGNAIGNSKKMLLSLVGTQMTTGMVKNPETNGFVNRGNLPMLLRPVEGKVSIKVTGNPAGYVVYSLNSVGDRESCIKASIDNGLIEFEVGGNKTPWYEIVAIDVVGNGSTSGPVIRSQPLSSNGGGTPEETNNQGNIIMASEKVGQAGIKATLTQGQINQVIKKAEEIAKGTNVQDKKIIIETRKQEGITSVEIIIPIKMLEEIKAKGIERLELTAQFAKIGIANDTIDTKGLNSMSIVVKQQNNNELTENQKELVGNNTVYDLKLKAIKTDETEQQVINFDKQVEMNIPYELKAGENAEKVTAFYVSGDGELKNKQGKYDAKSKMVTFEIDREGTYIIKENKVEFNDIDKGSEWARKYIEADAAKGIVIGISKDKYEPKRAITRAEFAALLARVLNLKNKETTKKFKDVNRDDWYYSTVMTVAQAGLVEGYQNETFRPDVKISRQDMAVMAARALKQYKERTFTEGVNSYLDFNDATAISEYAKESIALIVQKKIVEGKYGKMFDPKNNTTRAEVAKIMYTLFNM